MTNVGSALFFDGTALFEGTAIIETTITYSTLEIVDPEFTFYPGSAYTPSQLDGFATMILRAHIKSGASLKGPAPILMEEHLKTRHRREIYNKTGVPDPSIQQGNYWRTHPDGRKVNTEDARKRSGASFYRLTPFLPLDEYLIGKELLNGEFGEKEKIGCAFGGWRE